MSGSNERINDTVREAMQQSLRGCDELLVEAE